MSEFDILLEAHSSSDCKECIILAHNLGAKEQLDFNIREIQIVHDWLRSGLSIGVIRQRLINIIEKNQDHIKELK
jgi:hypothetical protein